MSQIKVTLTLDRETKGSVLYKTNGDFTMPVQNIYIKKHVFTDKKWPKAVHVTVDYQE